MSWLESLVTHLATGYIITHVLAWFHPQVGMVSKIVRVLYYMRKSNLQPRHTRAAPANIAHVLIIHQYQPQP